MTSDATTTARTWVPSSKARRAAVALLGEGAARRAGRIRNDALARARNSVPAGRANVRNIQRFENRHAGETCVIIGNGPSLNATNLESLSGVATFGLNRIYLMYGRMGFATTYNVVSNSLVVDQCAQDLRALDSPLFTTYRNHRALPANDGNLLLNELIGPRFSTDPAFGIWVGGTVTFVAMQLAYYMGFSTVVLVGVDHNFRNEGPAHKVVVAQGPDPDHFDPNYFGKGVKWQLPDLETSEVSYGLARRAFEEDGRRIVDCTVGGKLQIFEKAELADALR